MKIAATKRFPKKIIATISRKLLPIGIPSSILLGLSIPNSIPKNWWQSSLLNWTLSSQTISSLTISALFGIAAMTARIVQLRRENRDLREKLARRTYCANLTPEQTGALQRSNLETGLRRLRGIFNEPLPEPYSPPEPSPEKSAWIWWIASILVTLSILILAA
jgi:uncharacterized integral membrane protein